MVKSGKKKGQKPKWSKKHHAEKGERVVQEKDYSLQDSEDINRIEQKILSGVTQDDTSVQVGSISLRKISEDIDILPARARLETFLYKMPHESWMQYDLRRSISIKLHEEHGMSPLVAISRGRAVINRIWYGVTYSEEVEKDIHLVLGSYYANYMKAVEPE
jgi:hypothetical protein